MLYTLLKPVGGIALRWYYRSITTAGLERVPRDGPVFLAANHPNALVDALVLGVCIPRRVRFTAKATIFANPLAARFLTAVGVIRLRRASDETRAGASGDVDPARNQAAFDAVAQALAERSAIVIFPEGKSHDDPKLAPLRTGLARMTLHAVSNHAVSGIRIVPVGLLFERKEQPRSRILLQIGEPLDLDALPAGQRTVATLTQLVADRLAAVTLNFDSPDDAERLQAVGRTLAALLEPTPELGDDEAPLASTMAVIRRLDRGLAAVRARADAPIVARAAAFEERVRRFSAELEALGLDVHDVGISPRATPGMRFAVREALLAAVLVPVGLWGRITHFLPIQLARRMALRNVTARDEPAMKTLVAGLVTVLLAYALQTAFVAALAGPWWGVAFLLSLVPSASSDLRYGDRTRRARARARAYFRFRREPDIQRALLAEAEAIRREAGELEQATQA